MDELRAAFSEMGLVWRVVHQLGLILWIGGLLAQVLTAVPHEGDVKRLSWTLELVERLGLGLVVPGLGLALVGSAGRALAKSGSPGTELALKLVLTAAAVAASVTALVLVRRARGLIEERRENLRWEREAGQALVAWRLLTTVALAVLGGAFLLGELATPTGAA